MPPVLTCRQRRGRDLGYMLLDDPRVLVVPERHKTLVQVLPNVKVINPMFDGRTQNTDRLAIAMGLDEGPRQIMAADQSSRCGYHGAFADGDGFVTFPNVNPVNETVNLMTASRGYDANATAVDTLKTMAQRAIDISR